jgi:hypothetical protein
MTFEVAVDRSGGCFTPPQITGGAGVTVQDISPEFPKELDFQSSTTVAYPVRPHLLCLIVEWKSFSPVCDILRSIMDHDITTGPTDPREAVGS